MASGSLPFKKDRMPWIDDFIYFIITRFNDVVIIILNELVHYWNLRQNIEFFI